MTKSRLVYLLFCPFVPVPIPFRFGAVFLPLSSCRYHSGSVLFPILRMSHQWKRKAGDQSSNPIDKRLKTVAGSEAGPEPTIGNPTGQPPKIVDKRPKTIAESRALLVKSREKRAQASVEAVKKQTQATPEVASKRPTTIAESRALLMKSREKKALQALKDSTPHSRNLSLDSNKADRNRQLGLPTHSPSVRKAPKPQSNLQEPRETSEADGKKELGEHTSPLSDEPRIQEGETQGLPNLQEHTNPIEEHDEMEIDAGVDETSPGESESDPSWNSRTTPERVTSVLCFRQQT